MPAYQSGRNLVLNTATGQSGDPLCANSPISDACDLLRLDTEGGLTTGTLSASKVGVNAVPSISSALLSITASADTAADLICVSSSGRSDCDLLRLSGSGTLTLAGRVIAEGGFQTTDGDITTSTGSVTAGGSIATEDSLSVKGSATVGGDTVLGAATVTSLAVTDGLDIQGIGSLTVSSLNATNLVADSVTVSVAMNIDCPLGISNELSVYSLVVEDTLAVYGDVELASLWVSGNVSVVSGLNVSGDVLITEGAALSVESVFVVEELVVNGSAFLSALSLSGPLGLETLSLQTLDVVNLTVAGVSDLGSVSAANISIISDLDVGGDFSVAGVSALAAVEIFENAVFSQSASFLELSAVNISSQSLSVTKNVVVEGRLTSLSETTLGSLLLLGDLNATYGAYLNYAEIGTLATLSELSTFQSISLLGNASLLVAGSITALGDLNVSGASWSQHLSVAGDTSLGDVFASSIEALHLQITGSADIEGNITIGGAAAIAGNVSAGSNLSVAGEVRASSVSAEETMSRTTYRVDEIYASYVSAGQLIVNSSANFFGSLVGVSAEFSDLMVLDSFSSNGEAQFEVVNVTGALQVAGTLTVAADVFINDGGTLYVSGDIATDADLDVGGNVTALAVHASAEMIADKMIARETTSTNLTVTDASTLGQLVTNGVLVALEGITSPKDIVTTEEGNFMALGTGGVIASGVITGLAGITSPISISTTGTGVIHSAGLFTASANVSVLGNVTVGGSVQISKTVNASAAVIHTSLNVGGVTNLNGLVSSGLIAGNAGVATTALVSANLTLNSLVVNGLINASSITVDTAIWTPALRYSSQPVLFSGYSDIFSGKAEACSILC